MFQEADSEPRMRSVPLSHLSIEVGHLYFEDFRAGPQRLQALFRDLRPWLDTARDIFARGLPVRTPRISTCFLLDDYFGPSKPPSSVIPDLLEAATAAGVRIDYLAREAGCAQTDDVPLASLVEQLIVDDPPPHTNGARPPVTESGWLCNGRRSPGVPAPAMETSAGGWQAPSQNAANRHSVFVDVEVWNEGSHGRVWSCAFLAAVWQLVRLGLLRHRGEVVCAPRTWDGPLPDDWEDLPTVMKVNPSAAHFNAYRSLSILPKRFLTTEYAVRTILDQVAIDGAVVAEVLERSGKEGLNLPPEATARMDYIFTG